MEGGLEGGREKRERRLNELIDWSWLYLSLSLSLCVCVCMCVCVCACVRARTSVSSPYFPCSFSQQRAHTHICLSLPPWASKGSMSLMPQAMWRKGTS